MPAIGRLELVDVITVGRRHLVHVFYDRSFQGAIHEAASVWRAKLHPIDLGDFHAVGEAKEAVSKWFAELEKTSCEEEPDKPKFSDLGREKVKDSSDTSSMHPDS